MGDGLFNQQGFVTDWYAEMCASPQKCEAAIAEIISVNCAAQILECLRQQCRLLRTEGDALVGLVKEAEKRLPAIRVGFLSADERQAAYRLFCRVISAFGAAMARYQRLVSDFLGLEQGLSEIQVRLERAALLLDALGPNSASDLANRLRFHIDTERELLTSAARLGNKFRDPVCAFAFDFLPNFGTRMGENVDFDGEGAACSPQALRQLCIEFERKWTSLLLSLEEKD